MFLSIFIGLVAAMRGTRLTLVVAALSPGASMASYSCSGASGEVIGEVQGETGSICATRCNSNYECPTDVPSGALARPQCMLKDVNDASYCGLLCSADAQCPSGAFCKRLGSPEVSICVHPLSFSEWAKAARTKLAVGWPAAAGASSKGFQLAKSYAALQSLKRRFMIPDGDSDVLVVKELLTSASSKLTSGGGGAQAAFGGGGGGGHHQLTNGQNFRGGDLSAAAYTHDINYFMKNMADGPDGWDREFKDTMWNLEHLEDRHVAAELFRSIVLLLAVYFGGGSLYKYSALGATGMDAIPHVGFWMEYPSLVNDGVTYFKMLVNECMGGRPSGAGDSMGRQAGGHGADRDTFSTFEPIK